MDANSSKIGIANRACIEMGAKLVSTFTDGSLPAFIINTIYDDCREEALEEHPFSFATKTVLLQVLSGTPVDFGDGASIIYAVPNDYLSLYKVNFPNALIRFESLNGQDVIYSNTSGLVVKYIFNNDDPTTYSAKFKRALALKIASVACFKIIEAAQYAAALEGKYDKAILTAIADDSKMSTPDQPFQDNIFYEKMAGANAVVGNPNGNIGFFVGQSIGF